MLEAPWSEELEQVILRPFNSSFAREFPRIEKQLAQQARQLISSCGGDGEAATIETTLRGRHQGQSHDLEFHPGDDPEREFRELYQQRFGYQMLDRQVEAVAVRVAATLPPSGISSIPAELEGAPSSRRVVLDASGRQQQVQQIYHGSIVVGQPISGPALVISSTTTLWLPEGASLHRDTAGTLIIDPGRE
jgi:N-methylhydantoinase A/oxoprolinase/acetone carboxylase beta subunit